MFNYTVATDQTDVHASLRKCVLKHLAHPYQRPQAPHSLSIFEWLVSLLQIWQGRIILDSGCGRGMSTQCLAANNPDALVIGIDKSSYRLPHIDNFAKKVTQNYLFVHMDLIDFYCLAAKHKLHFDQHWILYPNPWPKPKHFMRRWPGHPVFPQLLSVSEHVVVRSNWQIYLAEWNHAVQLVSGQDAVIKSISPQRPLTHFEAKYIAAKQPIYECEFLVRNRL